MEVLALAAGGQKFVATQELTTQTQTRNTEHILESRQILHFSFFEDLMIDFAKLFKSQSKYFPTLSNIDFM